ncbi:MAG: ABC transporter permease [Steroidobacteraceae bacterium]
MTLGGLIVAGLSRNWLRSSFTLAAIVAAFCLFGALQTINFERYGPTVDQDVVVVQPDGSDGLPPTYEEAVLLMQGVRAAVGLSGLPVQNVKTPAQPLIIWAVNEVMVPKTFSRMNITTGLAARWKETRVGAICDEQTAKDMGWKVHDLITVPLLLGMRTSSGEPSFEAILLGTYPTGLALNGLLIRHDYLSALFPQNAKFAVMFVRPTRARDARSIARRIDERFAGSVAPTLSLPLYEARRASEKNASTVGLVMDGALAVSFFTMVLIVTNALTQSARERIPEMAIMEALGFRHSSILMLVAAEALISFAVGALLGLLLANVGFRFEIAGMRSNLGHLPWYTVLWAGAWAIACAVLSILLPWWELSKVRIAEALGRL